MTQNYQNVSGQQAVEYHKSDVSAGHQQTQPPGRRARECTKPRRLRNGTSLDSHGWETYFWTWDLMSRQHMPFNCHHLVSTWKHVSGFLFQTSSKPCIPCIPISYLTNISHVYYFSALYVKEGVFWRLHFSPCVTWKWDSLLVIHLNRLKQFKHPGLWLYKISKRTTILYNRRCTLHWEVLAGQRTPQAWPFFCKHLEDTIAAPQPKEDEASREPLPNIAHIT